MGIEKIAIRMIIPPEYACVQLYAMWNKREGKTDPVRQASQPTKTPKPVA